MTLSITASTWVFWITRLITTKLKSHYASDYWEMAYCRSQGLNFAMWYISYKWHRKILIVETFFLLLHSLWELTESSVLKGRGQRLEHKCIFWTWRVVLNRQLEIDRNGKAMCRFKKVWNMKRSISIGLEGIMSLWKAEWMGSDWIDSFELNKMEEWVMRRAVSGESTFNMWKKPRNWTK